MCPGAAPARETEQRRDERGRELAAVHAAVHREGLRDAEQIEHRLRAVFRDHGEEPPPGLTTAARVAAAANAPGGTRTPRLLGMGLRAVTGSVRWAWRPGTGGRDADNRAQARRMYRSLAVAALLGALAAAAAARSSGGRRLAWSAGAAMAWLSSAVGFTVGTAVTQVARAAAENRRPGP